MARGEAQMEKMTKPCSTKREPTGSRNPFAVSAQEEPDDTQAKADQVVASMYKEAEGLLPHTLHGDHHMQEEVLQRTGERLAKRAVALRFESVQSRRSYLRVALKNNRYQVYRDERKHQNGRLDPYTFQVKRDGESRLAYHELDYLPGVEHAPDPARAAEDRDTLNKALASLTKQQRRVFELVWFAGSSRTQIAYELKTSLANVSRTYKRAEMTFLKFLETLE
jgi:RNA polymerase sigma factor (sigma-70 family)